MSFEEIFSSEKALQICRKCIYDESVPGVTFDGDGVCNLCRQIEMLKEEYGTGSQKGQRNLESIVGEIKKSGRGKRYDCVIGVSGGVDSSYLVYLAKEWGLRPLAVHYDNTWNSAVATENIRKVLSALNVDLYTHVIRNEEADDLIRSFFLAGVAEIDAPTDLAIAEVMYRAAYKYGVKYILEGHSFVTEGITPLGRNYFDGKYIASIHKQFGRVCLKSYPLMTFSRFLWWSTAAKIRKIRPYWYMSYTKEEARLFLEKQFGWRDYGGHHLENRIAAFYHVIYAPQKYGVDCRNNTLSALVRMGKLSREEAWIIYKSPPVIEDGLVQYFQKRIGLTSEEYQHVMSSTPKFWWEYPTYKKRFERLRPLFAFLAKANLVPMSFYLKYCFPKDAK